MTARARPQAADLFSMIDLAAPPPPRPTRTPAALPAVPPAWERVLGTAPDVPIIVYASVLWTGVVREVLCTPPFRRALFKDGTIHDLGRDSVSQRIVYMAPADAEALLQDHGLVLLGPPTLASARFRFLAGERIGSAPAAAALARITRRPAAVMDQPHG